MPAERPVHPLVELLFGGVKVGRVGRLGFAKGVGLALAGLIATALVFDVLVRGAEGFSVGGPPSWFGAIVQLAGFVLAAIVFTVVAGFAFAVFNLIAKRARDLGLAGWKALTVATMLGTAFSLGAPPVATGVYVAVVWALLLGLPGQSRHPLPLPEPR